MKCNRCENNSEIYYDDEPVCYDCALGIEELDEAVFEEDCFYEIIQDAAEKQNLARTLQEIAEAVEAGSDPSPADVVRKVIAIVARLAVLEECERNK